MQNNKAYRMISIVLVALMVFAIMPYMGYKAYAATPISNGDYSIGSNGEYQLSDGYSGTITVGSGVTKATIIGDEDGSTNTGTRIVVAGGRTGPLELTIKDLDITAPANNHGIDFGSAIAGVNKLYTSGTCRIVGGDRGAGIHVPLKVNLTIDKASDLGGGEVAELEVIGGYLGAGIGGGNGFTGNELGFGGTITISGGTVIAKGGDCGAGIGGGNWGSGGKITISGGTVTATGGDCGAGIGGGNYGSGEIIEISGDIVTATGGSRGAGIGGGDGRGGGTIIIKNDPTIIATRGAGAPDDIGNGYNPITTTTLEDSSGNSIHYIRAEIKDLDINQSIPNATVSINDGVEKIAEYKTDSNGIIIYFVKGSYDYTVIAKGYPTSSGHEVVGAHSIRKTYRLDNTPPKLSTATINTKTLVLTYNEELDISKPAPSDFEVIANGSAKLTVGSVAIANNTVTLTLENAIKDTDIIYISYIKPTQNPIQDKVGNIAKDFQDVFVTNNTSDTTASRLISATVNKGRLELDYDEDLDEASVPDEADFTVKTSEGSEIEVLKVDIQDNSVILILKRAVSDEDTITISYTKGTNPIQGLENGCVANFINEPVNNNIKPQLSKLTTSIGLWDENFSTDKLKYTINVDSNVEKIDITAATSQNNAYIIIDGKAYGGGEQTSEIDLDKGINNIPITVKTFDGSITTKYELTIIRGLSSNADLDDLQLVGGTIDGGFDKDKEIYTITPGSDVTTISITAETEDTDATLTIDGNPATSGTKVDIDISTGGKLIPIVVTAGDGETKRIYLLSVNAASSDAKLQSLSIDVGTLNFDPLQTNYSISINNAVTTINIKAVPSDNNAMMILKDDILKSGVFKTIDLGVGKNTIKIMVVAQDGITNTYTININRSEALIIENTSLKVGVVGMNYSDVLSAKGETQPYKWSAKDLPAGLSLNENSGEISGVPNPNTQGNYDVVFTVTDSSDPKISTSKTITLKITLCGNGGYLIKPDKDDSYTAGMTSDGIPIMTVNQGVSGFKYFSANITPVTGHADKEVIVFMHLRNGKELRIDAMKADFDMIDNAQAGFNVKAGDVIKVYIVDDLTNDENSNPNVL